MTEPGLATQATTAATPATAPTATGPIPQRTVTRWMQRLAEETTTTSDADVDSTDSPAPAGLGSGILLALGLLWLAVTMWTAHASIVGNAADAAVALGSAAGALPSVIAASILAGATVGLAAATWLGARGGIVHRLLLGLCGGTVCGLLAAGAILFGYGANSSIAVLAVTVGIGSLLGGAVAALPRPVLAAGVVATLAVFLAGVLFNVAQPQLTALFGAGDTPASQATASTLFAYTQSIVSGLLAGLIGYWYLRRRDERPWPWYLLAGAIPGLLLLLTELLTRVGGASLLRIVSEFSAWDRALVEFTDFARLRNALLVLFVGGIAAMIAVGRTLSGPESD
jgi:hypothetical protein